VGWQTFRDQPGLSPVPNFRVVGYVAAPSVALLGAAAAVAVLVQWSENYLWIAEKTGFPPICSSRVKLELGEAKDGAHKKTILEDQKSIV
jgi:hypothetical protein